MPIKRRWNLQANLLGGNGSGGYNISQNTPRKSSVSSQELPIRLEVYTLVDLLWLDE